MKPRKLGKRAFARALRHGLGSAHLHVKEYGDEGVENILIDACLTDLVYDRQADSGRARWLARMLDASGRIEYYASKILEAIHALRELSTSGVEAVNRMGNRAGACLV